MRRWSPAGTAGDLAIPTQVVAQRLEPFIRFQSMSMGQLCCKNQLRSALITPNRLMAVSVLLKENVVDELDHGF
jgi:hypothetical protein